MEGKVLSNRYKLINKVGGGGMAIVYRARCALLNRNVAVKVLRSEFINDEEFVKRFKIEAQAAASLSHPNIVSIYDVGHEGDVQYIIMEFVDGITLKDYIDGEKVINWREAINISIQICSALEQAHKNKIIHRDIKPHNILLTKEGVAKVADFGIARAATNTTITMVGSTIGSVHYFSPEQARGGFADEKSDLYSLGITLYEMVTGVLPFDGETPVAVALKHLQQQPKPPVEIDSNIPIGVNDIIMKAMRKEQDARYQNANEMLEDLYKVLRQPNMRVAAGSMDNVGADTRNISALGGAQTGANYNGFNSNSHIYNNGGMAYQEDDNDTRITNYNVKEVSGYGANPYANPRPGNGQVATRNKALQKRIIIGAVLLGLLVLAFIIGVGLAGGDKTTKKDVKTFKIANYVGQNIDDAKESIKKQGFTKDVVVEKEANEKVDKDKIIEQTPVVDTVVKADDKVTFTISLGKNTDSKDMAKVPNVVGKDVAEAKTDIDNAELTYSIEDMASDTVEQGKVVKTYPIAGASLEKRKKVTLYVSSGKPKNGKVKVPNLVDVTKKEALKIISDEKLKLGNIMPANAKDNDKVKSQSLPATSEVEENSIIDLVFDSGGGTTDERVQKNIPINAEYTSSYNKDQELTFEYSIETIDFIVPEDKIERKTAGTYKKDEFPKNISESLLKGRKYKMKVWINGEAKANTTIQ